MKRKLLLVLAVLGVALLIAGCASDPAYVHIDNPIVWPLNWQADSGTAPATPTAGMAYYNTTDHTSYYYDGSAWHVVADRGAPGATGPAGPAGTSGATALSGLTDVTLSSPSNGQSLTYNSSSGKWVNSMVTGGGGSGGQNDGVYVDSVNGVAGTGAGVGTPQNPVSNPTDALTIADTRNLDIIYLWDTQTNGYSLPRDLTRGYQFIGSGLEMSWQLDLNGKNAGLSKFTNLWLTGTSIPFWPIEADHSNLKALTTYGIFKDSFLVQEGMTLLGNSTFVNLTCDPVLAGTSVSGYAFIDTNGMSVSITGASGALLLKNITSIVVVIGNGLSLALDSSDTGGTIDIYGDVDVTDNSAGTVVNDHSLQYQIHHP